MFCQNSCKLNSHFEWEQYSPTTQKALQLTITGVALAGIALLTIGLLSHFKVISGLNAITQWNFVGVGSFLMTSAGLVSIALSYCISPPLIQKKPEELKEHIEQFCQTLIESDDPLEAVHQLARQVSLKDLLSAIQIDFPECEDAWGEMLELVNEAEFFVGATEPPPPSFYARLEDVKDTLIGAFDSTLAAFGVSEFFKPAESDLHADFKFQKIMMLISLFTLLTSTLLPLFGVTTGASIVGGTLLGIAILSVIWPKIRPMPIRLPEAENLSKQVALGQLWVATGRQSDVNRIHQALLEKKHPILYGESGVGKTQTVYAFVQALERGEFPELAGKKVFYFNTAALVANYDLFGKNNSVLKRIYEAMGRHRDQYILVFDEIHEAFKDKKSIFGGKLKTYLDDKPENNFPHVIGLTTAEEYYQYIYTGNAAIDRRYEPIHIDSTDAFDTLGTMHHQLLKEVPQAIVDEDALQMILSATTSGPQPLAAKKILVSCVEQANQNQSSILAKRIEKLRSELRVAHGKGVVHGSALLPKEYERRKMIREKQQELDRLVGELEKEKIKTHHLRSRQHQLQMVRKEKFQKALKLRVLDKKSLEERDRTQLKEFLLIKYFAEGVLESHLRKNNGVVINEELVERVIQEAKAKQQKKEEVLAQSKEKYQKRQELKA